MNYKNLREKYSITKEDVVAMNRLRRKWAFDYLMAMLESGGFDDFEPTDEQVERILDEYVELRVYDRSDWELEQESDDMCSAIDKVMKGE